MKIKDLIIELEKYDSEKEIIMWIRKSQSKLAGVQVYPNGDIVLCNTDTQAFMENREMNEQERLNSNLEILAERKIINRKMNDNGEIEYELDVDVRRYLDNGGNAEDFLRE